MDNNNRVFFELVKAGLWEKNVQLSSFQSIDYENVMQISEEQSVIGLVTAGLEHVSDVKIPKEELLQYIGQSLQLEQQNQSMNAYVAELIELLRKNDVYAILVKGQGVAQCYEKPLWRASGDIDLLLSDTNYEKAKNILLPLAIDVEEEYKTFKHLGMTMRGGVVVELHGTLHSRLSMYIDKVIDEAQNDVFYGGNVRSWMDGKTQVFLPGPNNDVIFVFTHILHHYYIEGIGLRQICDWCRLLYTYKDSLNHELLESRIRKAGLMTEWKAFAAFAVDWLGMPKETMPLYSPDNKWKRKADKICSFIMEVGNFGHNREIKCSKNYFIGKVQAAWFKMGDFVRHAQIFPLDSIKFFCHYAINGMLVAREQCSSGTN